MRLPCGFILLATWPLYSQDELGLSTSYFIYLHSYGYKFSWTYFSLCPGWCKGSLPCFSSLPAQVLFLDLVQFLSLHLVMAVYPLLFRSLCQYMVSPKSRLNGNMLSKIGKDMTQQLRKCKEHKGDHVQHMVKIINSSWLFRQRVLSLDVCLVFSSVSSFLFLLVKHFHSLISFLRLLAFFPFSPKS